MFVQSRATAGRGSGRCKRHTSRPARRRAAAAPSPRSTSPCASSAPSRPSRRRRSPAARRIARCCRTRRLADTLRGRRRSARARLPSSSSAARARRRPNPPAGLAQNKIKKIRGAGHRSGAGSGGSISHGLYSYGPSVGGWVGWLDLVRLVVLRFEFWRSAVARHADDAHQPISLWPT